MEINFPLSPATIFYDYIYVVALVQNLEIANKILGYYCYTDVEFNHKKQFASQARSCAIYKHLVENNKAEICLKNIDEFKKIYIDIILRPANLISLFDNWLE